MTSAFPAVYGAAIGANGVPMPAGTTKPNQETWKDPPWTRPYDPPQLALLTREQLIERVRENGFDVSARDLIYWEASGILPRAVKQRHENATRAVYPYLATYYVVTLRELQSRGWSLEAIAEELRRPFHRALAEVYEGQRDPAAGDAIFHPRHLTLGVLAEARRIYLENNQDVVKAEVLFFDRDGAVVRPVVIHITK